MKKYLAVFEGQVSSRKGSYTTPEYKEFVMADNEEQAEKKVEMMANIFNKKHKKQRVIVAKLVEVKQEA